jgi:hypothetical protein
MRKAFIVLLIVTAVLAFGGVSLAIHQGSEGTSPPPKPQTDAGKVWQYISSLDNYTKWSLWPGTEKLYKGTQPHGAFLTTYVSEDALQSIKRKKGTLPNRSLVVKENYMPDKKLAAITVMYKVKGYNPEAGDWFWAKYKPDGTVEASGKVAGCIKCHSAKASNDWVFTSDIK